MSPGRIIGACKCPCLLATFKLLLRIYLCTLRCLPVELTNHGPLRSWKRSPVSLLLAAIQKRDIISPFSFIHRSNTLLFQLLEGISRRDMFATRSARLGCFIPLGLAFANDACNKLLLYCCLCVGLCFRTCKSRRSTERKSKLFKK